MKAYIGLGSNLENPIQQILNAFDEIKTIPTTRLTKRSRLYQNPPVGKLDQPDFINAVAEVETELTPQQFLNYLLKIENNHHRIRVERNGARTLDLDILLYEKQILMTDGLILPHPRLKERTFVLLPLYEIVPNLVLPTGEKIGDLVKEHPKAMMVLVAE